MPQSRLYGARTIRSSCGLSWYDRSPELDVWRETFRGPLSLWSELRRIVCLLVLLLTIFSRAGFAQQDGFDRDNYYRAVGYCRLNSLVGLGPMTLSPDRKVLCFDGEIVPNMNVSLAKDLQDEGLFVVRSPGGQVATAIALSNLIHDRHATVVVYDYCISACATFFLIASYQTYVLKDALVIWHNIQGSDFCTFVTVPRAGGPSKLRHGLCEERGDEAVSNSPTLKQFFVGKVVSPLFEEPPDSPYVRETLKRLYAETGVDRDIGWTIHPRYNPALFTPRIFYEAYPESQEDVDRTLTRLGLNFKVIYDP